MFIGNIIVVSFATVDTIIVFNSIWISVFVIGGLLVPYIKRRIEKRENF